MNDLQSTLRSRIHASGHRFTPQRQMILDAIHELAGHCTPDEVYTQLQHKTTAINRATVYRTLDFFLQQGFLTTATFKDNQVVYELAGSTPHHHLICQNCDAVLELDHVLVAPIFAEIEQHYSFRVNTNHLMLYGLCEHCFHTPASSHTPNQR